MKKITKDIIVKNKCSLPTLGEVIENHNVLLISPYQHWNFCKKRKSKKFTNNMKLEYLEKNSTIFNAFF